MDSQFKKGALEICILKVLTKKSMSTFEIMGELHEKLEITENTIYSILRRLQKDGLINPFTKKLPMGAPRKYFELSELGEITLKERYQQWKNFIKHVEEVMEEDYE